MYLSIAYVECHSHQNAATLKNFFDNKYVYTLFCTRGGLNSLFLVTSKTAELLRTTLVPLKGILSGHCPKVLLLVHLYCFAETLDSRTSST